MWVGCGLLVGLGAVTPGVARSAEMAGSVPILCAVMAVTECDRWGACDPVDAGSAGLPPFVRVNVGQKTLEATGGSGRKSEIHSVTLVKDQQRLFRQGGEQGRLWSVVIGQRSGEMTAAHNGARGGGRATMPSPPPTVARSRA